MVRRILSKSFVTLLLVIFATLVVATRNSTLAQTETKEAAVQFVSVDDLKTKLAHGEAVAIIDVRGSSDLLANDNKIKGAIYVRLRRLRSRLTLPPLKDIPKDREIVAYCACPNDEASVRAVQILNESGYRRARVLKGGWVAWKRAKGSVEPMSKIM